MLKKVLVLTVFLLVAVSGYSKVFQLTDGSSVNGTVLDSNSTRIIVEKERGETVTIPLEMIVQPAAVADAGVPVKVDTSSSGDNGANPEMKNFYLYLYLNSASMLGGSFYDGLRSSLKPVPTMGGVGFGLGMEWYFLKYLGLMMDVRGYEIYNANATGYQPLSVIQDHVFSPGLTVRVPVAVFDDGSIITIKAFGGVNYTLLSLADEYKSVVQSAFGGTLVFYSGMATGFGFHGGIGMSAEGANGFLGANIGINSYNPKFAAAVKALDYMGLIMQFQFGLCF